MNVACGLSARRGHDMDCLTRRGHDMDCLTRRGHDVDFPHAAVMTWIVRTPRARRELSARRGQHGLFHTPRARIGPWEGQLRQCRFVATYECPGRDHNVWTSLYGPRAVVDVAPASRWRGETQGDTLRRALKLLPGPVDYVVVARPDVLFVTEVFPPAVLRSKALVIFHARLDGAVTDKLHVLRGEGIACFIQSITNGNSRCFNHTADSEDDDDDGSYPPRRQSLASPFSTVAASTRNIHVPAAASPRPASTEYPRRYESGESCYGPVESLVDAKNVAFLRDLIPGTRARRGVATTWPRGSRRHDGHGDRVATTWPRGSRRHDAAAWIASPRRGHGEKEGPHNTSGIISFMISRGQS